MPLPSQKTSSDFPFKYSGQPDEYGISVGDYTQVQTNFDSRAIFNQDQINALIAALLSVTLGDSGASQIGYDNGYANVKLALDALLAAGSGSIPPDDTVTNSKLGTDVKVGSLALMNTINKTDIVSGINEHLADNLKHLTASNQSKIDRAYSATKLYAYKNIGGAL